ncbi:photosystem I assembly protein Ycf3 [Bacteroidales bacterium Barb6XT]|nr:photosystem I assembly protein Ycf3 [Bacteroidales bacterium Barb6XT]
MKNDYKEKGIYYMDLGESEKAIDCFQEAIDINPEDAEAYCYMGVVYANLGEFENVNACYQKAADINPENAEIYNEMRRRLINTNDAN